MQGCDPAWGPRSPRSLPAAHGPVRSRPGRGTRVTQEPAPTDPGFPLPALRQEPGMAVSEPNLYERLQIQYPPSPARGPRSAPAASCCALSTALATGTGLVLVLGAALAAVIVLHMQGQAELRAARAELTAVGTHLLPEPDGTRSPAESLAAVQKRKEQLGRWLQALALGWRHHRGHIYFFSGERKPWRDAEAACRAVHAHLASVTGPDEQDYLAREARGGSYWIGLTATGPGGSWHWVDGTAYSQAQSFWAPGQPDGTDHGQWGRESCAQIHPVGNGLWNDHNCNFTFPWVCKRDLSAP
ncbi:C-type lectin domain family 4 member F-like [Pezoporus wallicus]|uniref:C-type lectin domain family 4 member F-like n=1 Tax=Pezoporus wallicus TaxID=35540 RepID=UPI00254C31FD|nr:C-type lectin domain family 4 member F-like [Pezoporus wallicus]